LVLWLSAITQIAIENDEPRVVWDYNESQDWCIAKEYIF
jgi:hypothetical protein